MSSKKSPSRLSTALRSASLALIACASVPTLAHATTEEQLEARVDERTRELNHLAHHDPLTDLPNRRHLLAHLDEAIDRARLRNGRIALLFIDLDNFKTINDSMGHAFGDRVLQPRAPRWKRTFTQRNRELRTHGRRRGVRPGRSEEQADLRKELKQAPQDQTIVRALAWIEKEIAQLSGLAGRA